MYKRQILNDVKAVFHPENPLDLAKWFAGRDREETDAEALRQEKAKEKKYVEKSNKDETFKYHVQKVEEEDYSIEDEPVLTNEDLVLGVRPECIKLADHGSLDATVYGAMPTGMESTVKLRVGEFLLTGVIFGGVTFKIGEQTSMDIKGNDILLFDRKSGKCICAGALTIEE